MTGRRKTHENRITLKAATSRYNSFCLQGDVSGGFNYLKSINNPCAGIVRLRERVKKLFFSSKPTFRFKARIPWVREVLKAYSEYYLAVLTKKNSTNAADANLAFKLGRVVSAKNIHDLDKLEEAIQKKFAEIGWHFLGGITYPFRGPYIYEELVEQTFQVELPLITRSLSVKLMKKFHSLSWLNFATLGKMGTGGWAKPDGLYCVIEGYQPDSEKFRINYLKHEAQHFDDYSRFPFLLQGHQEVLEFRAKLVELVYAESLNSFKKFISEARNDEKFPHLLASYRIRKIFAEKMRLTSDEELITFTDLARVKELALKVYLENTSELDSGFCFNVRLRTSGKG